MFSFFGTEPTKEKTKEEIQEEKRLKRAEGQRRVAKAFGHVLPVKPQEVLAAVLAEVPAASPKVTLLERVLAAEPVLPSLQPEARARLTGFPSETPPPLHITKAELADPTVLNGLIPQAQDKAMFEAAVGLVNAQRIEREVKEAQQAAAEAAEARVKALRKFIREREAAEAALSKAEQHVRGATKKKRSSVLHILSRPPRHSLVNASRYAHLATLNEAAEKEALGVALAKVEALQAASAAAAQTVAEAKVLVAVASADDYKPEPASKSSPKSAPKSPKPSPIPELAPAEKKRSFLQRAHRAIFGTAQRKFPGRVLNGIPGYKWDRTYKNLAKHLSNRFWNMRDNEGVMRSRFGRP
jgi:hypothetical protein